MDARISKIPARTIKTGEIFSEIPNEVSFLVSASFPAVNTFLLPLYKNINTIKQVPIAHKSIFIFILRYKINMQPSLNTFVDEEGDDISCPVCWENLEPDKVSTLGCSHYICKKCCEKLLKPTCPLCRQPIPGKTECLLPPVSPIQQSQRWVRRHPRRRRRRRGPRLSSMNRQGGESGTSTDNPIVGERQRESKIVVEEKVSRSDKKYQKKKTRRFNNYFNNCNR